MFSFSPSSQASAGAPSSVQTGQPAWAGESDDVALGCECADPALQIAMWGQESAESTPAVAISS